MVIVSTAPFDIEYANRSGTPTSDAIDAMLRMTPPPCRSMIGTAAHECCVLRYAFIAAIVGGFNQIRGAIVGGLLLGVVDNFAAAYLSAQYRMAVPLVILIVVILWRPQGLLGRVEERTV